MYNDYDIFNASNDKVYQMLGIPPVGRQLEGLDLSNVENMEVNDAEGSDEHEEVIEENVITGDKDADQNSLANAHPVIPQAGMSKEKLKPATYKREVEIMLAAHDILINQSVGSKDESDNIKQRQRTIIKTVQKVLRK